MGFLIDTCIWIGVEQGTITPADVESYTGSEPVFISPVTIAEPAYGVDLPDDEAVRTVRRASLDRLKKKPLLIIDEATGEIFGRIAASLFRQGKQARKRVQDIWLAAQAVQHNHSFLTRNEDVRDIPGLRLVVYGR